MHTTITGALENFIELEHRRVQEHKEAMHSAKQYAKEIKNEYKSKLEKEKNDLLRVLLSTEQAMQLQTMKLALAHLQLENRYLQHIPTIELKDDVINRFTTELKKAREVMGMLAARSIAIPNTEKLWQKMISEAVPPSLEIQNISSNKTQSD